MRVGGWVGGDEGLVGQHVEMGGLHLFMNGGNRHTPNMQQPTRILRWCVGGNHFPPKATLFLPHHPIERA